MGANKIRVLIVDDSSVMRMLLKRLLETDGSIEVIGTAHNAAIAWDKMNSLRPDVVTLDIVMPDIDGIRFLERIMGQMPTPTIVISALGAKGSEYALKALSAGAIDIVEKPSSDTQDAMEAFRQKVISLIREASESKPVKFRSERRSTHEPMTTGAIAPRPSKTSPSRSRSPLVAIASSTGGTEALKQVLTRLPANLASILIVQHMPRDYTKAFAQSLTQICPFAVKEAVDGDKLSPSCALLAPGDFHMEVVQGTDALRVRLHQAPPLHGVRPAADHLLNSVARLSLPNSIGVVLTGMGRDGAQGLLAMKKSGSFNIAQDEDTCVVFGMPKEAIHLGAIHRVVPLPKIADMITAFLRRTDLATPESA